MFIESVIPSNQLTLCCPVLFLPSVFPSIRVFSSVLALHIRWPKYWSFSISASNEYSGLISFRIDWFDLLAVHGTLKSLLQHHSLKASILLRSVLLMVQLSHPYMAIENTLALTIQNFVSDVSACRNRQVSRKPLGNSWKKSLLLQPVHLPLAPPIGRTSSAPRW